MLKLIASLTSPYARKVRIALAEKKIEYALRAENPWTPGNPVTEFNPQRDKIDPDLARLAEKLAKRPAFAETIPPAV